MKIGVRRGQAPGRGARLVEVGVQPAGARRVDRLAGVPFGVAVAVTAADPLVAAGAERPSAVPRRRSVAGQEDAADVGRLACVVERGVELVDGVRAEGVAHLRPVERDPHGAEAAGAVVGHVGEREPAHGLPGAGIEQCGDHGRSSGCRRWAA